MTDTAMREAQRAFLEGAVELLAEDDRVAAC